MNTLGHCYFPAALLYGDPAVCEFHSPGKHIRDTESRLKSKRRMVTVIFYIHRELIVVDIDIPQNGIFAFHFGTLPEIDHVAHALVLIKSIRSDRSLQPLVPAFRPVSVCDLIVMIDGFARGLSECGSYGHFEILINIAEGKCQHFRRSVVHDIPDHGFHRFRGIYHGSIRYRPGSF